MHRIFLGVSFADFTVFFWAELVFRHTERFTNNSYNTNLLENTYLFVNNNGSPKTYFFLSSQ